MMKFLIMILIAIYATADILNISSFEGDFRQKIINELNQEIIYEGKVYIKKPNNALWEYTKPIRKSVYLNDNKVYIVEPELEQVTITTLTESLNFIEILNKAKNIGANQYSAKLDGVDATLSIQDNKIYQLEYIDNISNKVQIIFSNQKQNMFIDTEIFRVIIPDGYDTIH